MPKRKSVQKKHSSKKSNTPAKAAKLYTEGTRRKGRDGKMWQVKMTAAGYLRWVKCGGSNKCNKSRRSGPFQYGGAELDDVFPRQSQTSTTRQCTQGTVRDPVTGRCERPNMVSRPLPADLLITRPRRYDSAIQLGGAEQQIRQDIEDLLNQASSSTAPRQRLPCPPGTIRDPHTGRCRRTRSTMIRALEEPRRPDPRRDSAIQLGGAISAAKLEKMMMQISHVTSIDSLNAFLSYWEKDFPNLRKDLARNIAIVGGRGDVSDIIQAADKTMQEYYDKYSESKGSRIAYNARIRLRV